MAKALKQVGWGWTDRGYVKNLWMLYGITLEKYDKLWVMQDGKCAGCLGELAHPLLKKMKMGLRPEVDHEHTRPKGEVRGLLCRRCNDFLGKIQDDNATLKRLEAYLVSPPGRLL